MADCDLSFLDEPLPPGSILRSFPCGGPSAGLEAVDLVSLQESFLTALERSDDIAEHAKIILDSVSAEKMELEKGVTAPDETNNNPPRGRRPGMGRKKARFSMRPTQSQNLDDLIPNLDTENLADPDEYFAAVDKIEAAKREINRLKGQTSPNAEERVPQGTKRERRPGLGIQRKKLGYVHLGPTTEYKGTAVPTPEGKKTLISSPVNVTEFDFNNSSNNLSLPGTSTRKDAIDSKLSNDDKHKGSGINKESSVRNLLDSLLSSHQSLEGEDGMKLLQEKLQLKQMNVEKIRLPDYLSKLTSEQDITNAINGVIQEADAGFNEIIPRKVTSNRPPLSAISPLQNNNKKPRLSQLLSSLCNSPLAAMAMLQKKVSLADSPISAAYSSSPIDDEIGSGTPNAEEGFTGKEASKYSSGQSRFISSQFEVDDQATDGPTNLQNLPSNKPETPLQNENDVASSLSHFIDREIYHSPEQESEARSPLHDRIVKTLRDDSGSGPVGDNVECLNSEVSDVNITAQICTPCDIHADRNQQPEVDRTGDHDLNIVDSLHQGEDSEVCKDQQPLHASTDQENGQPNPISQAKKSEETPSSRVLVKKKACRPRKKWTREVSRRKSLASAGTKWKAGVRRSSRHKIKPLEFWRGERVLYGRIHESLATVIGVKCSSPGGDTALKVKSYVPDKYKDLVELAARY